MLTSKIWVGDEEYGHEHKGAGEPEVGVVAGGVGDGRAEGAVGEEEDDDAGQHSPGAPQSHVAVAV